MENWLFLLSFCVFCLAFSRRLTLRVTSMEWNKQLLNPTEVQVRVVSPYEDLRSTSMVSNMQLNQAFEPLTVMWPRSWKCEIMTYCSRVFISKMSPWHWCGRSHSRDQSSTNQEWCKMPAGTLRAFQIHSSQQLPLWTLPAEATWILATCLHASNISI